MFNKYVEDRKKDPNGTSRCEKNAISEMKIYYKGLIADEIVQKRLVNLRESNRNYKLMEHTEKRELNKKSIGKLWDNIEWSNIHVTKV